MRSPRSVHLGCGSCGALLDVDAASRAAVCVFCASPNVVERSVDPARPAPSFVLPFTVQRQNAKGIVADFLRRRRLDSGARIHDVQGVYLPTYVYGGLAQTQWSARIGESYLVRSGDKHRTEWEFFPLQGIHTMWVTDVLVSGSRVIGNPELENLEPFDLRKLRRYDPRLMSGWAAEEAALAPVQGGGLARNEAMHRVGLALKAIMPGDKHEELGHHTHFERESADLTYVPVWILTVTYEGGRVPVRVLVNGQSGKIWGPLPERVNKWPFFGMIALFIALCALAIRACVG